MVTSAVLYHFMNFFHVTIDIRNVCVFLAPLFSSLTTLVTYHLTKELKVRDVVLLCLAGLSLLLSICRFCLLIVLSSCYCF